MEQALSIMCVAAQKEPKQVSRENTNQGPRHIRNNCTCF